MSETSWPIERELIRARTDDGRKRAQARGMNFRGSLQICHITVPRMSRHARVDIGANPIQSLAAAIGVEVNPINVRDASEIERAILATRNSGLIVTGCVDERPLQSGRRQAVNASLYVAR